MKLMKRVQTNKDKYLVSAIVSTYNAELFIRGCLEDLENQTINSKLEIIVVDSASQQNEKAIIREFQQYYNNIVYIRTKERETIYTAWNRGIKIARGKYITNANADDRHCKDALEIMAKELDNDPGVALVFGDQILTQVENETLERCTPAGYFKWPDYDRVQLLHTSCIGPQPMWRKSLHDEMGYFDENLKIAGDYEWWLRVSEKYPFKHIPKLLGLYFLSDKGAEHSNHELCNLETHAVRRNYLERARIRLEYSKYRTNFIVCSYKSVTSKSHGESQDGQPMVSVIVPTYNRPELLIEALRSIINQTDKDFEIIIVNDGGHDVKNEVMELKKEGSITYVEHSRNRGIAAARNSGIKKARGKYIAYLDDDDIFYSNHLETLVDFLEATGYEVAYSNSFEVFQKWGGGKFETVGKKMVFGQDFDRQNLLVKNCIPVLNIVHRKDCIEKVGFFDEDLRTHEDWDLWIRMSQKFSFYHIKTVTTEFRTRLGSSSLTSSNRQDLLRTMEMIHSRYSNLVSTPDIKKAQMEAVRKLKGSIDQKILVTPMLLSRGLGDVTAKVSVVISAINGGDGLKQLLSNLRSQRRLCELEIIVIGFQPSDSLVSTAREFDVRLINISRKKFDRTMVYSYGITESKGEFIVFTTDNTLPINKYWLYKMVWPFIEYPELSALSSRQFVKPDADLFKQWLNYKSTKLPIVLNSDLIYSSSKDFAEIDWSVIDNQIKRGLACFNESSFCIRRDILGEVLMHGGDRDFALSLLGMKKAIGYLNSTGVYHCDNVNAADVLKRHYVDVKKQVFILRNEVDYIFNTRDISLEHLKADITGTYNLVSLSLANVREIESDPVTMIRLFIDAFQGNLDNSPDEMVKTLKEKESYGDVFLGGLLKEAIDDFSHEPEQLYNFRQSVMLSDFMNNFKEFAEYLCSRHISLSNEKEDFNTSVFKLFAGTAGEVLSAYYLEAETLNRLSPDLRRIDELLGKGVCYF